VPPFRPAATIPTSPSEHAPPALVDPPLDERVGDRDSSALGDAALEARAATGGYAASGHAMVRTERAPCEVWG